MAKNLARTRGEGGSMCDKVEKSEAEKTRNLKNTKPYKVLKNDLISQLKRMWKTREQYIDLINDYMNFWIIKKKIQDDIDKRGVNIFYNNGGGQSGVKKNDSVSELIKVNSQMLSILDKLGIKPTEARDDTAKEEDKEDEPL